MTGISGSDGTRMRMNNDDIELMHLMADRADEITMERFRAADLRTLTKSDMTPVSEADHRVEEELRQLLSRRRPDDAVLGEEFGGRTSGSRSWLIDPIDGTAGYVRGVPVWASLLAVLEGDRVTAGLVSAPALGRRWWASRGNGAWAGAGPDTAQRCHVSGTADLTDASISYSEISEWERGGLLSAFLELNRRCGRSRAYGDFWSHMLVAEGTLDLSVELELEVWDLAPLLIILEEAGAAASGVSGLTGVGQDSLVCANPTLHRQALSILTKNS
ncbi:inositol monophosphatase family protein [Streptomyces ipomoeae]|uniref:inositol monophosphatase family protein n=1 Tax=Streptomyces ipomoeae TaxID=103232 RepID=UPI0011473FA8|nr:inositol monophosphatase family protein [Streptomyces ipomoeae]MDX2937634.1 histidinol phosphatase [Streptomyces ipomoeae]TQE22805.1 histidinol phosphatase [Streptomyces ipomoeae]